MLPRKSTRKPSEMEHFNRVLTAGTDFIQARLDSPCPGIELAGYRDPGLILFRQSRAEVLDRFESQRLHLCLLPSRLRPAEEAVSPSLLLSSRGSVWIGCQLDGRTEEV